MIPLTNKINIQSLISLFLIFFLSQAETRSISVGPLQIHKTICEGITAALPGDTIMVDAGIYKEGDLTLRKSVHLIGKNFPVLDGEYIYEIITISGKNISISGFKMINSGASSMDDFGAIKCVDAKDILIYGNRIENTHFAIHISNSTRIKIIKNTIIGLPKDEQNTGNGIHLWKSDTITIEHNKISGHRDGIYLEFVTASSILHNLSTDNIRYGLHFMFSHNDFYRYNTFKKNGAGVAVMYSHNVDMEYNTFENNWGSAAYGILLKDITDSKIHNNKFTQNTIGIFMEGNSRIIVEKNIFKDNGWALRVQASCNENVFRHNNFFGNSFDVATNGTLMLNSFSENYWDKYDGYDRNKNGFGDIPFHPVNLYAMIVEQNPVSLILLRSILISFLDKAEKAIPSITPIHLIDDKPKMTPNIL